MFGISLRDYKKGGKIYKGFGDKKDGYIFPKT